MSTLKRVLIITLCILSVAAGAGNVVAAPSFSEASSKQAVLLLPLEVWRPTWNLEGYVSALERAGYQVDILFNGNVSISFLRTGLAKYDIIVLRTDSFERQGMNYYCSGEPVTRQSRATFAAEISARELDVRVCVGFSLLFLRHNYPAGSLRPGLVLVVAGGSAELASAFLAAGSSAFIGYYDMYSLGWGSLDAVTSRVLKYLSQGSSVKDAVLELYRYLGRGHGHSATMPSVYWSGNGDFKI